MKIPYYEELFRKEKEREMEEVKVKIILTEFKLQKEMDGIEIQNTRAILDKV